MPKVAAGPLNHACDQCDKRFAYARGLREHKANKHGTVPEGTRSCIACDFKWRLLEEYRLHCQKMHSTEDKKFAKCKLSFPDETSFQQWKGRVQEETRASFATNSTHKDKVTGEVSSRFYRCSCSGLPPVHSGERQRFTGSMKAGGNCPAYLTVKFQAGKGLAVEGCLDHLGHLQKLGHLRIPEDTRLMIVDCLVKEVPVKQVLRMIRSRIDKGFTREHIVDRKDIHNIKKQYSIDPSRKHEDDYESVKVKQRQSYSSMVLTTCLTFDFF